MSGSEALQQLRSRGHTSLPVVAVTANTMNEDVTRCMHLGFSAFLSKPCRKGTVRAKVRELVAAYAGQQRNAGAGTGTGTGTGTGGATAPSSILQRSPNSRRRALLPSSVLTSTSNGQIMCNFGALPANSGSASAGPLPSSVNLNHVGSASLAASLALAAAQPTSRITAVYPPAAHRQLRTVGPAVCDSV